MKNKTLSIIVQYKIEKTLETQEIFGINNLNIILMKEEKPTTFIMFRNGRLSLWSQIILSVPLMLPGLQIAIIKN